MAVLVDTSTKQSAVFDSTRVSSYLYETKQILINYKRWQCPYATDRCLCYYWKQNNSGVSNYTLRKVSLNKTQDQTLPNLTEPL